MDARRPQLKKTVPVTRSPKVERNTDLLAVFETIRSFADGCFPHNLEVTLRIMSADGRTAEIPVPRVVAEPDPGESPGVRLLDGSDEPEHVRKVRMGRG